MSETSTPHTPAGRYGPDPTTRARWPFLVALVIGGALVVALIVWVGAGVLRDPVQWMDVGYSVKGPGRIDVTFDVIKDPAATAECTIHALSSGFAEVGVTQVTVGPAPDRIQRQTVTVATQELAVTGIVDTCRVLPAAAR
ncbi:MAG TPA: DUF4307 domain-containing protein [Pengzhenrongella sp.]